MGYIVNSLFPGLLELSDLFTHPENDPQCVHNWKLSLDGTWKNTCYFYPSCASRFSLSLSLCHFVCVSSHFLSFPSGYLCALGCSSFPCLSSTLLIYSFAVLGSLGFALFLDATDFVSDCNEKFTVSQAISLYRQFKQQNLLQSFKYTTPYPSSLLPSPASSLHLLKPKTNTDSSVNNNDSENNSKSSNNDVLSDSDLNSEDDDLFLEEEESRAKRVFSEIQPVPDVTELLNKEPVTLNRKRALRSLEYDDLIDRLVKQIIRDSQEAELGTFVLLANLFIYCHFCRNSTS